MKNVLLGLLALAIAAVSVTACGDRPTNGGGGPYPPCGGEGQVECPPDREPGPGEDEQ